MNKRVMLLTYMFFAGIGFSATGQEKNKPATDSTVKKTSYEKLLKDPQKVAKGMMNLYYAKTKLYLEVPMAVLGRDMLLASTISETSDNLNGIVGSKPQALLQVRFVQVDSILLLTKVVRNNIAPDNDSSLNQALAKNSIGAIMEKFDIVSYNPGRSAAVIDITNYFLSDNKELSPFGAFRLNVGGEIKATESFKKDRSYIEDIKSFADNVTIKSHLSYESTISDSKRYYAKDKPFSTVMTHTFLLLPEQPMRPRTADSRVGIFYTRKFRLSGDANKMENAYYANRWNLVPKDPAAYKRGVLTEPVKPIVFYVDSDFPTSWKQPVKDAINEWQTAFEKIGFKNAIVAMEYPANDPEFDPDNLKYNCVRYAPTPIANAIGPSWVDPRSGEIINASVYVFHDIVKLLNNWMFIQISPADKEVRSMTLPESYKNDGIKYVVRHEIGHCLGFMHNFGSSASIPVDSLRSPSFTKKYGTTHSIMDYARFNYVAQPGDKERGVQLSPPAFGLYDYFITKWNYTYFDSAVSTEDEKTVLAKMVADKAGDPRYRYGAQGKNSDPSSLNEDLGDNALKASEYGIKNLKYIMHHLNEWVGREDKDFAYRGEIWEGILSQYVNYINHVYANVGGIITNEKYVGDPVPLFESVPRAKQIAAMNFLLKEVLDLEWLEDSTVLNNIELTGTPATLLQGQIIAALMQTPLSVSLSALKSREAHPFTPKEAIDYIYSATWASTMRNRVPRKAEKEMQKAYVKSCIKGAKLIIPGKTSSLSIYSEAKSGITLPEFISHGTLLCGDEAATMNKDIDPVAGFGGGSINFNLAPDLESLYFSKLLKSESMLKNAISSVKDKETLMHYKLLLIQIERALK